jgi:hypothetical protein
MRAIFPPPFSVVLVLALTFSCSAGWHQPLAVEPGTLPARQQVQVWQHQSVLRWHAVQVRADSISGIPFVQPIECERCRVAVPRASVDSLRVGNPVAGFWKSVGLGAAGVVALGVIICWKGCPLD